MTQKHQASRQISKALPALQRWMLGVWLLPGCWSLGASLEIQITPRFAGEPLQLETLLYENAAQETFSVTRVSYLLTGFALQRADGSWLELTNQCAWMDAARSRASLLLSELPPDAYRKVRFHIGPDEKQNHADVAQFPADHPLNPNLNGLHWSWQGGYIFLALEGLWQNPNGTLEGWSYHLAHNPNRTSISLAASMTLTQDTKLELDFDLATLLQSPHPLSFSKDGSSTHSRPGDPVAAALVANLPGAFSVRNISAGKVEIAAKTLSPHHLPGKFTPYPFQMSSLFPIPDLPRDNPLIAERVALGEQLFHEPLLSKDDTVSCASCHDAGHAFSEPRRYSVGVRAQTGTRNAMPLFNLAWKNSFFWDGRAPSLRAQVLLPIQDHAEMDETLTNVCEKLANPKTGLHPTRTDYPKLFAAAFDSSGISPEKIALALESYALTLTSFDSRFDRALNGGADLSAAEKRGFELFMTEYDPRREQLGADCFHCHGGPLFQSQTFANNGLDSAFPDPGRAKITGKDSDLGKFATPSLRNIALTAPYMHDGRFQTLEEVVEHYASGVKRSATLDPNLAKHPDGGVPLSAADKQALVAFLRTLTDEQFAPRAAMAANESQKSRDENRTADQPGKNQMKTNTKTLLALLALGASAWILTAQEAHNPPPGHCPPPPDGPPGPGMLGHRPPPPPVLGVLDADHDGVIDAGEIANASQALLQLDENGDGKLDREELSPPFPPLDGPHGQPPFGPPGRE